MQVDAIQSTVLSNGAVTKVVVFTRDGAVEIKQPEVKP